MSVDISSLFSRTTASEWLAIGLDIAAGLGVPVTSWRTGDPTKTQFVFLSNALALLDVTITDSIKARWLSTASGAWLRVLAKEVFGVDAEEADYATPSITLHNGGGGYYDPGVGDLTFKSSISGKTYTNTDTSDGPLAPGATRTYALIADEAGSESSVATNEIDTFVTQLLGATIVSSTAASATDDEDDESLKSRCRDTLGALSPNGPPDAYRYVATNAELTGRPEVSRVQVIEDSTNGTVTVYIAQASGSVGSPVVTDVQAAIDRWARPLTVIPSVASASTVPVDVTAVVYGDLPVGFESAVELAVDAYISSRDVGETVYRSALITAIHEAFDKGVVKSVDLILPAANVGIPDGFVAITDDVLVSEG